MEFPFDLNEYFTHDISVIGLDLFPVGFHGSSQQKRLCPSVIGDILNKMGETSARAQKLISPVTSAIKYSNSNHVLYLMVNLAENNGQGTAIGYLKMGWKDLFIFDLDGMYVKRRCFCCLDFYIHESKQRQGFGKKIYDYMLLDNKITANTIPVDRPSEKCIKFLQKHYNLRNIIPQSNNFIVYEQFFCNDAEFISTKTKLYQKAQPICRLDYKPRSSIENVITDCWYKGFRNQNR